MATDIAFVVGCMAVLGKRVPRSLKVLLLSLAIADDIGAILVIAIGYTESLNLNALLLAFVGLALVAVMSRVGVRSIGVYTLVGVGVWLGFHESGVHATIAGVILGLLTPVHHYMPTGTMGQLMARGRAVITGDWAREPDRATKLRRFQWAVREMISPVEYLENLLHPWVSFVIMPLFALANAGVPFEAADFGSPVALAVMAGLIIGKPVGILSFSWLSIRMGLAQLPGTVTWRQLLGGGFLAGIGFTMALFIAGLALNGEPLDEAKVGILGGSAISAVVGILILLRPAKKKSQPEVAEA
jgi:NhaA family Na+:H+ antiporter